VLASLAAAATLMLVRACGDTSPPQLRTVSRAVSVPLVSTYTPTPAPTPAPDPTAAPSGPPAAVAESAALGGVAPTSAPTPAASPALAEGTALQSTAPPIGVTPTITAGPTATAKPRGHRSAAPTVAPAVAPATAPVTATAAAAAVPQCAKSALAVSLRTDAPSYDGHAKPKLYLGIVNIGKDPCRVDLGSVNLRFTIRSGKDRIWSSADCQGKGSHDIRTLVPGRELWARSVWSQVRSKRGCPDGESNAQPGTYVVEGSAAGVNAQKKVVFRVR
jgi:hypothetical protein